MSLLEFDCRLRYASGFQIDAAFSSDAAVTALWGPSGSGKTSILSMIAGLRRPDDGRIKLAGRVLFDRRQRIHLRPERRQIGYVFQGGLLFPHLNVRGNLVYGWRRRRAAARRMAVQRVVEVLDLGETLERMPHTLSGGQRQRVALGRALLSGAEWLLLDEPLTALDESLKERVVQYVELALKEWRIPAVYVTHDPAEVRRMATWVVRLEGGRVRAVGAPQQVLAHRGT